MSDSAQPVARPSPRPPRHRLRLINAMPSRGLALFLGSLPFLAVAIAYLVASADGSPSTPATSCCRRRRRCGRPSWQLATVPDQRSGDLILWADTYASLRRLFAGVGAATLAALMLGVAIGFIPRVRALLLPFVAVVS